VVPHHEQQTDAYPGANFVANGCCILHQQDVWLLSRLVFATYERLTWLLVLGFSIITVLGNVVMLFLNDMCFVMAQFGIAAWCTLQICLESILKIDKNNKQIQKIQVRKPIY